MLKSPSLSNLAAHRGQWEPAGLAPNLGETWLRAKECSDGPAWPGCRLWPVTSCHQDLSDNEGPVPDMPPRAAWFPPADSLQRAQHRWETSGHEHCQQFPLNSVQSQQLYGLSIGLENVTDVWARASNPGSLLHQWDVLGLQSERCVSGRCRWLETHGYVKNTEEMLRFFFKFLGFFLVFSTWNVYLWLLWFLSVQALCCKRNQRNTGSWRKENWFLGLPEEPPQWNKYTCDVTAADLFTNRFVYIWKMRV